MIFLKKIGIIKIGGNLRHNANFMDKQIDYITFTSTEINHDGEETFITGNYFIPFLDYFFIYTSLILALGLSALVLFLLKRK